MRIAFLKTGQEQGVGRHILSLLSTIRNKGHETLEIDLTQGDIGEKVKELSHFAPQFVLDMNSTGFIVGQQEDGKKVALCDTMGFAHVGMFTDEPLFYFPSLLDAAAANNFLPVVCDLKYADTLRFLGLDRGYFYITPFIDREKMLEPEGDKDFPVSFLGPVIHPDLVAQSVLQNLKEEFAPLFFEVGDFLFRNPEAHLLYAFDYIFSMFNPTLQESFLRWRQENPQNFLKFLKDVSVYATSKKRWYILSFLEGIGVRIIGGVQGELPEGHQEIEVSSWEELLRVYDRSMLSILVYPHTVPTGIGFSPLEACYMQTAVMVDYRATLPGFLLPDQEVITFLPLDRAEIEEKVLYYLDNPQDALEIAQRGRRKIIEKFSYEDRAEFLLGLFENLLKQAVDVSGSRDAG